MSIKVDMIKFLMTMFDSSIKNTNGVKQFKNQVEELVRRNQIPMDVRNLVYNIYGITNTDVYKPNLQQNKLMQINYLMMYIDSLNNNTDILSFKKELDDGIASGSVLKSAYDIIVEIYELDSLIPNNYINNNLNKQPKMNKTEKKNSSSDNIVEADIKKFKSEYVSEIYYYYPNPYYDGCSGSTAYLAVKLLEAKNKPEGAKLCIKSKVYDDGCHARYSFVDVPSDYYI